MAIVLDTAGSILWFEDCDNIHLLLDIRWFLVVGSPCLRRICTCRQTPPVRPLLDRLPNAKRWAYPDGSL